jgi:transposase
VYIPGFISNIETHWEWPEFAGWLHHLGTRARVIIFDKRGTGLSDRLGQLQSYVKAYVKRSKNDAAAICEAVTRPSMRFVSTKSEQQQSPLMLHRGRQLLVRQRTMRSHACQHNDGKAKQNQQVSRWELSKLCYRRVAHLHDKIREICC